MNRRIEVASLIVRKVVRPLIGTPSSLYQGFGISVLPSLSFSPPFRVPSLGPFRAVVAPYPGLVRGVVAPFPGLFPSPVVAAPSLALYLDLAPDFWVVQPREAFYPCGQNDYSIYSIVSASVPE